VVLAEIKENLKKGKRCIVISTQLIEAGVDIDFPVVFRSSAGIDSIAQAAGRCNREGDQKQVKCMYLNLKKGTLRLVFKNGAIWRRNPFRIRRSP
jgi:CRISPR/Cas system-associated endonuclease/helicase Cas3